MKMTSKNLRYQLLSIIAIVFILGFPGQDILQAVARETLSGGMTAAEYNELAEKFNQAKRTYKDFRVESVDEFIKIYNYREKLISDGKIKHKFRTRSGQEIYCIDIYSQGSIKRAGLKHEDIRFAPEVLPNSDEDNYDRSKADLHVFGMDGSLDENGNVRKCPKGSFPRWVPSLEDFCRFRTLEDRFRKYPVQLKGSRGGAEGNSFLDEGSGHLNVEPPGTTHEYAHAYRWVDNIGQQADFNVWNPEVEGSNEFSLCQLWVVRGSESDRQTVETGWQKCYSLYGDWDSHLFIYFTTHNYDLGYPGGYNLDVSGFVQTNSSVIIGGTLSPVSTIGGSQYSYTLMFFRNPGGDHHWWLKYGDTWVGYYPNSLFDSEGIANKAEKIDYGGEIVNQETGGLHTTTDMGSGRFPDEGWQYSAFVKHIRYVDMSNYYQDATGLIRDVTDANYYDLILYSSSDSDWKQYFYYGGPGRVAGTAPSVTTNVATNIGQTSATLNSTVNPNGSSTTVYYDYGLTTSYGSSVTYGNIGSGTTGLSLPMGISDLQCNTTYHFRARATNSGGTTNGNDQTFTTTGTAPSPPTNVQATDGTYTDKVRIIWNASSGATSYEVYRATSSGGTKSKIGTPSGTSYDDTSASIGTTYYYWVKAKNSYGISGYSSYDRGWRSDEYSAISAGSVVINHEWKSVNLQAVYTDPVVITGPLTYHGTDPGVVRLQNVTDNSFDIRFQEWLYKDGSHTQENISYLALFSGRHQMANGSIWEAGTFFLSGTGAWTSHAFTDTFPSTPALFLTAQTYNGSDPIVVRARNVTNTGFGAALFEEENKMDGHTTEEVGYLAVYSPQLSGTVNINGTDVPYLLQAQSVDHRFVPVLSSDIKLEEEKSNDSEVNHCDETVSILALGDKIFTQDISSNGYDTIAIRRLAPEYNAAMEWGTVDGVDQNWMKIPLAKVYLNPVVVAKPVSSRGGDPGVIRIRNASHNFFELRYNEWAYLDGSHTQERVFYMVAEAGERSVAGLTVEAGRLDTSKLLADGWELIAFSASFSETPSVFTSVQTYNGADPVTTRLRDCTFAGFDLTMDEEEAKNDGHTTETLGWIAIKKGTGNTADNRSVVVLSGSTNHIPTQINFGQSMARRFPVVVSDMITTYGSDPGFLRYQNLGPSSIHLFMQEEASLDAEMNHAKETLSVFAGE